MTLSETLTKLYNIRKRKKEKRKERKEGRKGGWRERRSLSYVQVSTPGPKEA